MSGYNHSFIWAAYFLCLLFDYSQCISTLVVALVSSLRETSILFAVLLGVLALKEKFTIDKVILVTFLVVGIVILYWP